MREPNYLRDGETFGYLTVVRYSGRRGRNQHYECQCVCGKVSAYQKYNLLSGNSGSCGCMKSVLISLAKTVHGHSKRGVKTKEYRAWKRAKGRCYNLTDPSYARYGGRGIRMCAEWLNDFQAFFDHIGPAPTGLTLDRINNDGNYEPGNVRWATPEQQCNNQCTTIHCIFGGECLSISQIARRYGMHSGYLWYLVVRKKMEVHAAVAHRLENRERTRLGLKRRYLLPTEPIRRIRTSGSLHR